MKDQVITSTWMTYDSAADTYAHIDQVRQFVFRASNELADRAWVHDASKLRDPEKAMFDEFTPKLRDSTYGSPEYKEFLAAMGEGLKHHYAVNNHHPEHFKDGIRGMNLLDLIEMLCDWKAATMRHTDGDLDRSITQNRERFEYGDEIEALLRNTARDLGLL